MVLAIVLALVAVGAAAAQAPLIELLAGLATAGALAPGLRPAPRPEIKALVWTDRARRLYATALAVPAVVLLIGAGLTIALGADLPFAIAGALAVAAVGGCAWVLAAVQRGARAGPASDQRALRARGDRQARRDRPARDRDHRQLRQDDDQGLHRRGPVAAAADADHAGVVQQPARRDPHDQRAPGAVARSVRGRDGHVPQGRHHRAVRARASADRRADRDRPGAPGAAGLDRGDRRREVGAGAGAAGRRPPGRQRR